MRRLKGLLGKGGHCEDQTRRHTHKRQASAGEGACANTSRQGFASGPQSEAVITRSAPPVSVLSPLPVSMGILLMLPHLLEPGALNEEEECLLAQAQRVGRGERLVLRTPAPQLANHALQLLHLMMRGPQGNQILFGFSIIWTPSLHEADNHALPLFHLMSGTNQATLLNLDSQNMELGPNASTRLRANSRRGHQSINIPPPPLGTLAPLLT
jgi:hypothetical protein